MPPTSAVDPAMETDDQNVTPTPEPTNSAPQSADEFWDDFDAAEITHDDDPAPPEAEGQPRGPDGKFLPKQPETQTPEGSPEAEAAPSHVQPPEGQTDPNAPATKYAFQYRAMGQTHELPDVQVTQAGDVLWPAAKVGDLRAALNAKHLADGQFQPLIQRQAQEIATLRQQVEAKSVTDTQHDQLMQALVAAIQTDDDAEFVDKMFGIRSELPQLLARAEADYWKQQAAAGRPAPPTPEQAPEAHAPTLPTPEAAVEVTVDTMEHIRVSDPQFRDVTPEDWQQIQASLQRTPFAFLRPATDEEAQQYGVQPGQLVQDTDALHAHLTAMVTERREARATAQRSAKLAADTARRTTTQVQTPPSAGGAKAPPKSPQRIQSKEDMENYWDSDEA